MNIEQPTSPPEVKGPTSYYRDQARERVIAEALSGDRRAVAAMIADAICDMSEGKGNWVADAFYAHAQERACGSGGFADQREAMAYVGLVLIEIVDDYIMGIPRWQDRANDLAWEAWDDDQEGV